MIRMTNSNPSASVLMRGKGFQKAGLSGLGGIDYSVTNDVAIAGNTETLGVFKGLQRVVNMVYSLKGLGKAVYVDGQLGPATLASVRAQYSAMGMGSLSPLGPIMDTRNLELPTSVSVLASNAKIYADDLFVIVRGTLNSPFGNAYSTSAAIEPGDKRPSGAAADKPPVVDEDGNVAGSGKKKSNNVLLAGLGLLAVGAALIAAKKLNKVPARKSGRGMRGLRRCSGLRCR